MDMRALADQQRHIYQLCVNTGCSREDLPEVMDDRDGG